ncbi:hypothetical protein BpHYR1_044923 [Brachionus plicatilis]|uniref:Uncharacterized protein n=1 Tax=Brachionus plicatilis TaxID=10195 RepID=A0A3M7R636_BRAPC|nr:hypothetical protein BpHYR1_044923 [Brachionus plicatilis]
MNCLILFANRYVGHSKFDFINYLINLVNRSGVICAAYVAVAILMEVYFILSKMVKNFLKIMIAQQNTEINPRLKADTARSQQIS